MTNCTTEKFYDICEEYYGEGCYSCPMYSVCNRPAETFGGDSIEENEKIRVSMMNAVAEKFMSQEG